MDTKQPRATQSEMAEREQEVESRLSHGPMSISDLFEGTELTYSQAILLLRRMESQGKVIKLGKDGRNVIYALSGAEAVDAIPFDVIIQQIHQGNNSVKIVGLNMTPDHLLIGLQLPTGEIMNAELISGSRVAGAAA